MITTMIVTVLIMLTMLLNTSATLLPARLEASAWTM